ncbi:MAG: thiamine diphosphokinase [Ruminococcus sp.]|jgi:thiamine pyrophosphokinase|nr:thiamine diphosphokinase [Ruminococcus sp.]
MTAKRVFIFAAGMYYDDVPEISAGDFVIAADGGYKYCKEHEIIPDLIIGDFDSLDCELKFNGKIITLPVEKDVTDTAAALYAHDAEEFHIYGGTGGRLDHTIANIAVAAALSKENKRCFLYGDGVIITALTNGKISHKPQNRGSIISIFSHTDRSVGVTLSGLKYPLNDVVLTSDNPLGISNETLSDSFSIEVKNGTLILIYDKIIG